MEKINVKDIRERLRLSQKAFASRLGVHPRTIQNWEAGGEIPQSKHELLLSMCPDHYVAGNVNINRADFANDNKTVENINKELEKIDTEKIIEECQIDSVVHIVEVMQSTIQELVDQNAKALEIINKLISKEE